MARPIEKKAPILRAALELFVERGIAATTTKAIAARAQAAEGTMYRYVQSKEDLAWEIYFHELQAFMDKLRAAATGVTSTHRRLRAMIAEFFHLFDTDPVLYSYLILAEHSLIRRLPDGFETPPALLVKVLHEGRQAGEIGKIDVNEGAALVMGTMARLTLFRIYHRIDGDLSDRLDSVCALCWRALGPFPEPAKEVHP